MESRRREPSECNVLIGTSLALIAGLISGLLFRPLALIPVAILLIVALLWLGKGAAVFVAGLVALNAAYLAGAVIKRALASQTAARRVVPAPGLKRRSSS